MAEQLGNVFSGLSGIFWQMNGRQRVELLMISALTLAGIAGIVWWAGQADYEVLFYDMAPGDAAKVVEVLKEKGVDYKIGSGGGVVSVPSKEVAELRLTLAQQGLPESGHVGYEIFDQTNFGMSDFVQKVNYRRALEGELSRTLQKMAEVKTARVHIVIPEEKLFKEDEQPASASVILGLTRAAALTSSQIRGITRLLASSVEGLNPDNITIVDSYGNILSTGEKSDSPLAGTTEQMALQSEVEEHLAFKAQEMMDGVLGKKNSIVKVSVELDFERIDKTNEIYDPDGQVIRSEQITTNVSTTQDTSETSSETAMTKYEINKTIERIVNSVGGIKWMSVAVLINGRYEAGPEDEDGNPTEPIYSPRSAQVIANLSNIVRGALGFDDSRGDKIEVISMQFEPGAFTPYGMRAEEEVEGLNYFEIGKKVGMGMVAVIILLLLRSMAKQASPIRMSRGTGSSLAVPSILSEKIQSSNPQMAAAMEERLIPEVTERAVIQNQLTTYTKENAIEATSLLRSWLMED